MKVLKVAVVGIGNIGQEIVSFVDSHQGFELVALVCRHQRFAEVTSELTNSQPKNLDLEKACAAADVIVEAANKDVVEQILSLEHIDVKYFIPMSTGGLIDALFDAELSLTRKVPNLNIKVPSGAIAGLDAVSAVAGSIESLTITTTKPPGGLSGAPYFEEHSELINELKDLKSAKTVFRGSLLEAIKGFPKNINVAASLFLASDYPGLKVQIIADPKAKTNSHHIICKGDVFGTIDTRVENRPSANKRTSQLAILSGVATLKGLLNSSPAFD